MSWLISVSERWLSAWASNAPNVTWMRSYIWSTGCISPSVLLFVYFKSRHKAYNRNPHLQWCCCSCFPLQTKQKREKSVLCRHNSILKNFLKFTKWPFELVESTIGEQNVLQELQLLFVLYNSGTEWSGFRDQQELPGYLLMNAMPSSGYFAKAKQIIFVIKRPGNVKNSWCHQDAPTLCKQRLCP